MASKLTTWFPAAQAPVVISAPMLGAANARLAAAVSLAGGIGMVPGGFDFSPESAQLAALDAELAAARTSFSTPSPSLSPSQEQKKEQEQEEKYLPLGVGFILCHPS